MVHISNNIITSLILLASLFIIIHNLKSNKFTNKKVVFFTLINIFINIFRLYSQNVLTLPFSVIFIFTLLFYISKTTNDSTVLTSTLFISSMSEITLVFVLFNIDYLLFKENKLMIMTAYIMILFFVCVVTKGIYSISVRRNVKMVEIISFINNIVILIYVGLALLSIHINREVYKYYFVDTDKDIIKINIILTLIYFMLGFIKIYYNKKNIKKQITYKQNSKNLENIMEYANVMENMIDDSRRFRYDYINILSTINGYIEDKDIDGLEEYFREEILCESLKVSYNKSFNLKNIKISGIKGLLSSKIITALDLNLNVHIEINEIIDNISVDIIDICRVLGILLDNAIEAASFTKSKNLNIAIIKTDNFIIFIISNSFSEKIQSVSKLYDEGFSTKGKNRGIGLNIVKDTVEDYSNILLNTEIKDNLFKQELVVCNENKKAV
ncbi:GHKL domain protein [Clostridium argentinense CDC 2741]|uniref:GHKL domain protein n=2 Tax=Clostridium argentinense TaxID=29341 RepID=A0A0C1UCK7_9CLOT|nr:GHKL domain protein [Clostridium argentinense CDC 2741]